MFKKLVMFSSIVLLASLVICFAAYAYNAYCSKTIKQSSLTMRGAMNNHNLTNGMYVIYAKVTNPITQANNFGNQQYSRSVASTGSISNGGYSNAFVYGYDASGQYQSASDSESHP
ncbi:MAG: hypothetical protein OXP71_08065 [Candidatus Poribacteria bacterium]|nr:hypothetical protein [Candidatus Poribacteria bacterium]